MTVATATELRNWRVQRAIELEREAWAVYLGRCQRARSLGEAHYLEAEETAWGDLQRSILHAHRTREATA